MSNSIATTPTAGETGALLRYAALNGRRWKAALQHDWETGQYRVIGEDEDRGFLQRLRNRLGPSWLAGYRLP